MIRVGQLWENRDRRRPGDHRVLWVSDDGANLRIIRCGGWPGRYVTAAYLERRYRLTAQAPVRQQMIEKVAA